MTNLGGARQKEGVLIPRTTPRLALAFALLTWGLVGGSLASDRPNILLILADDLGYADLGFQGAEDIQSPNLDALAAESIRFTDGHTSASVCSPSRAGLMTGRYQQRFGHESNSPPTPMGMDLQEVTLADTLKQGGYRTGLIGKWHLGNLDTQYPTARGFDYFYGLREGGRSYFYDPQRTDKAGNHRAIEENGEQVAFEGYLTDVLGEKAVEFVSAESAQPFFLYLSFTAPHTPMHATEADLARFSDIQDEKRRTYAAMIWAMDRAIGKVLAALEAQGTRDNTLIWFLSDNGGATNNGSSNLPLAGHKGIKFEGGMRVPFILQWKARLDEGREFDPMISALDIFPTSVAAAGVDLVGERPLDGVNLLPFLSNRDPDAAPPHQKLYWHKLWFSAMRDGPWKLIYVQDYGYALYNLDKDLEETVNLIDRPEQAGRVHAMKADLNQWKQQMPDPLWREADRWFRTHKENHAKIIEGRDGR